jgi:hypothetical protein
VLTSQAVKLMRGALTLAPDFLATSTTHFWGRLGLDHGDGGGGRLPRVEVAGPSPRRKPLQLSRSQSGQLPEEGADPAEVGRHKEQRHKNALGAHAPDTPAPLPAGGRFLTVPPGTLGRPECWG